MSAFMGASVKAYVETLGLKIQAFRDAAPNGTKAMDPQGNATPFITITEDISLVPDGMEDGGAGATGVELMQLDLWQPWRLGDKSLESPTLADALMRGLHGARLPSTGGGAAPQQVYIMRVQNRLRVLQRDENLIHHAYTLRLHRVI